MRHDIVPVAACAILVTAACCSHAAPETRSRPHASLERIEALYRNGNYFALRDALDTMSDDSDVGYYRAAVLTAFGDPDAALVAIEALPATRDGERLWRRALLEAHLLFRLGRYRDLARRAASLQQSLPTPAESSDRDDLTALATLGRALQDVPPQRVAAHDGGVATFDESHHLPVRIDDRVRPLTVDTGANISVLMHSEAEKLRLEIRPAGVQVRTSTGATITADVAVAARVEVAGVALQNVVFLIFPDEALTFPEAGVRIPGLLGFPVLYALGELRWRADALDVPTRPGRHRLGNMALLGLDPIVLVTALGDRALCRIDSGANRTAFYRPFFDAHAEHIVTEGRQHVSKVGGVGGVREIRAYTLPELELHVGGQQSTLHDVDVYIEPDVAGTKQGLHCNIGQDLLRQFDEVVFDFRSMSFLLRGPRR